MRPCAIAGRESRVGTQPALARGLHKRTAVLTLLLPLTRLKILILANAALQLIDGYVTLLGVGHGFVEGNPLVRGAIGVVGPTGGVMAVKLFALGFLYFLYKRRSHPLVEPGLAYLAVVYAMMAIVPWTLLLSAQAG